MTEALCPAPVESCLCSFEDFLIEWMESEFEGFEVSSGAVEKPHSVVSVSDLGETGGGFQSNGHRKVRTYRVFGRLVKKQDAIDFAIGSRKLLKVGIIESLEGWGRVTLVSRIRVGKGPVDTWESVLDVQLLVLENS